MTAPPSPADPRSFLKALGNRPDPLFVVQAQHILVHIDSVLSKKISAIQTSPLPDGVDADTWTSSKIQEVEKLTEDAEKQKLPYKSVIRLSELHQIYEDILKSPDTRTIKTLEVLNSFAERNHVDQGAQHEVAKLLLEAAQKQNNYLDLSGRLLVSLPTSFGNISTLVALDLSRNQLKKLPESISSLVKLESLDLQSNQLSSLPDSIGLLLKLKILNVSGNMLKVFPESIGGCRKMKELVAGFNQLERLPASIGYDLVVLEKLSLHSNKLNFLPSSICELKLLRLLDLHFNNLRGLPPAIGKLTTLEKLNVSNNFSDFGGSLPDSLGDLIFLVELDLSFNQIRLLPDSIGALENLKILKVDNNPLVVPPKEVVEHSLEAVKEYMADRWKNYQTYEEVPASPARSGRRFSTAKACVGFGGSWLVGLLGGQCTHRTMSMFTRGSKADRMREWQQYKSQDSSDQFA